MSNSNMKYDIDNFQTTDIDSKYFNGWIGHDVTVIEPKLLFDLQELFKHYASIIVPHKNVKVNYPIYDTSACADTENDEIWIPTSTLVEGDIDNCIGLVVHELQHLSLSLKSSENIKFCFQFLNKLLQNIFKGNDEEGYESLYEIINRSRRVKFIDVFNPKAKQSSFDSPQIQFYRKAIGDIAFFLNAVEDVRIDSLTQPNLKKYIDVGDNKYSNEFIERYNNDEFKEKTLLNVGYCFLMHHKGFVKDSYIDKTYPDLQKLLNSTPYEWIPDVFSIYEEIFKHHVESLFNENEDEVGEQSQGSFTALNQELDGAVSTFTNDDDGDEISKAISNIEVEETELDEDAKIDGNKMSQEYKEKVSPKMIPLASTLIDQIKIMGNVKVYDNKETFSNDEEDGEQLEWNTIIVDTI